MEGDDLRGVSKVNTYSQKALKKETNKNPLRSTISFDFLYNIHPIITSILLILFVIYFSLAGSFHTFH